jgi:coproporphyrinogen III oxidase
MDDKHARVEQLQKENRSNIYMARGMQRFVEALQIRILKRLEEIDEGSSFRVDNWEREEGGGGITGVLEDGKIFEKAGVNTSAVDGPLPDRAARALEVEEVEFFATGISIVIHPRSPYVPSVHANFRYFALGDDLLNPDDQWFGGGADMTPHYPYLEDVKHFHRTWKDVCDKHDVADYQMFKEACDEYFYLDHRQEARGVGGIFFDYVRKEPEPTFFFVREAARAFLRSYLPIVERRREESYGARERRYQNIRRGRYAEFNLVYDRGTRFGLETGGRTESILMSMPPRVQWRYDWQPQADSPEAQAEVFFQPHDWLSLDRVPS